VNIQKCVTTVLMTVLAGMCAVVLWLPTDTEAGVLNRLGANFKNFDGTESFTNIAPSGFPPGSGGAVIYSRSVLVPPGAHTLYLTISATGDSHGGAKAQYSALTNGVACRTNPNGVDGAPSGWITLTHLPSPSSNAAYNPCNEGGGGTGDCHDNTVMYTWCCTITPQLLPTVKTATFKLASGKPFPGSTAAPSLVFLEKAHFYVDSTDGFGGQCGSTTPGLGVPR
jgi:hypothetical protein